MAHISLETISGAEPNISVYFSTGDIEPSAPSSNQAKSTTVLVFESFVMISIMLAAVFGNVLVITAVLKYERLRVITNYFVVSLAFADLVVAMLAMPFNYTIQVTGKWIFGRPMCDIFNANDVLFSTASIIHLCLISMDRYIAILHPLQYESKMSKRKVVFMLCVTWTMSSLISYIPIHSQWYTTQDNFEFLQEHPDICNFVVNRAYVAISSSISFWIPTAIMLFTYMKIFREARRQEKRVQAICMQHLNATNSLSNGRTPDTPERNERKRMKREHKAAKTLGIIMGAFILCWLPFFLWYVTANMCGEEVCATPDIIVSILFWIGYFNSCLNPIIYAYFNRDFRNAFKKLLHLDECCRRDPSKMALNATYTSDHRDSYQLHYQHSRRGMDNKADS